MRTDLLREAAEWRLLGLLFECPSAGWQQRLSALSAEVHDADLRAAAEAALEEATEGRYHSIFGPGGPAPAREVSYHETVQLGYLLSEIGAYYGAFAYQPAAPEPPDHVAIEAGFVAYLRLKEAYALEQEDAGHAAITREAAESFLRSHLAWVGEPLAGGLAQCGLRYLALAGKALAARTGPRPAEAASRLPVLEGPADEETLSCEL